MREISPQEGVTPRTLIMRASLGPRMNYSSSSSGLTCSQGMSGLPAFSAIAASRSRKASRSINSCFCSGGNASAAASISPSVLINANHTSLSGDGKEDQDVPTSLQTRTRKSPPRGARDDDNNKNLHRPLRRIELGRENRRLKRKPRDDCVRDRNLVNVA